MRGRAGALRRRCARRRIETLIGLLAVTGMRLGEAIALDRDDVDLDDGVLHVRAGKFGKQREVPLHPSTTEALREYARAARPTAGPSRTRRRSSSPRAGTTAAPDATFNQAVPRS